jgi:hypothetical protein
VLIQDRYTLIQGRFKKNLVKDLKRKALFEILDDLNLIPLDKFIGVYLERSENFRNLNKSLKILSLLNDYHNIMEKNIKTVSKYTEITESLILLFRYNIAHQKKKKLQSELVIAENFKKSSNVAAISDLLLKLKESIVENKKRLRYLEEDFLQRKNQIGQITDTLESYELRIKDLTSQKKELFSQINKITREMSGDPIEQKIDSNRITKQQDGLTNAQKIKNHQRKAKEVQFEIKKLNSKLNDVRLKFNEYYPLYETIRQDYQKLVNLVEGDKRRIDELQDDLNIKIKNNKTMIAQNFNGIDLKSMRSMQEIEEDLNNINLELKGISIPATMVEPQNPLNLSHLIKNIDEIQSSVKKQDILNKRRFKEEEIKEIFESFKKLESIVQEFESSIKQFLSEINLKATFKITIGKDNKEFFILVRLIRNNKEQISFNELTTPEKIFFIITYFLSIDLQTENYNIIISNIFLPSKYNKAGSIFRTIRKIIPIFEKEKQYGQFNLILIFSNLEMKKVIQNLKIITIQESE